MSKIIVPGNLGFGHTFYFHICQFMTSSISRFLWHPGSSKRAEGATLFLVASNQSSSVWLFGFYLFWLLSIFLHFPHKQGLRGDGVGGM